MGTHRQIFYHLVFATKHREPAVTESHCHELCDYIFGSIKKMNGHLYRINGAEDHLHIFSDLHPSLSLADYIKNIKVAGSLWMKEAGHFPAFTNWQDGYGAFTHSIKEKDTIIEYIRNQKNIIKRKIFMWNTKGCCWKMGLSLMKNVCCKNSMRVYVMHVVYDTQR